MAAYALNELNAIVWCNVPQGYTCRTPRLLCLVMHGVGVSIVFSGQAEVGVAVREIVALICAFLSRQRIAKDPGKKLSVSLAALQGSQAVQRRIGWLSSRAIAK